MARALDARRRPGLAGPQAKNAASRTSGHPRGPFKSLKIQPEKAPWQAACGLAPTWYRDNPALARMLIPPARNSTRMELSVPDSRIPRLRRDYGGLAKRMGPTSTST
jgi:hypothetical protein